MRILVADAIPVVTTTFEAKNVLLGKVVTREELAEEKLTESPYKKRRESCGPGTADFKKFADYNF